MFKKKQKEVNPEELLPFCMRCFNVGLLADERGNHCHMCGSGDSCISIERWQVKYLQENIDAKIDQCIEYGKEQEKKEQTLEDSKLETIEHINQVKEFMIDAACNILDRAEAHDRSKLESPEVEVFAEYGSKLKTTTYLSEEYNENLRQMDVALTHHYANNSHHPEHYKMLVCNSCFKEYKEHPGRCATCLNSQFTEEASIAQMDLFDLVEMICDWKAAVMRHEDGDIMESLIGNKERFRIGNQLYSILERTVVNMEKGK